MAEPAREDAPALPAGHPDNPGNLAHPSHAAWCDYRRAAATEIRAARLALEELAADPGNPRATVLGESILAAMEALTDLGRRRMIDESLLALTEKLAYERGRADGEGRRGCLRSIPLPG